MERIVRQHRLDAGMQGWIVNTAKKNMWRVPRWYMLNDLIQDGYMCYATCNRKYPQLTRRNFMSLVKVSYMHHITDLSRKRTNMSFEVLYPPDDMVWMRPIPEDATFVTLLRQAPDDLQKLIMSLLTNASRVPRLKRDDRTWETLNEWLCRLIDVDPMVVNIEKVFIEHFR